MGKSNITPEQNNQITDDQFKEFLNGLVIRFDIESEIAWILDSEENGDFASVNYESSLEEIPEEMYLDEDTTFNVTESQKTMLLEYVDEQTLSERNELEELQNEPTCKYELYGVSRSDFL